MSCQTEGPAVPMHMTLVPTVPAVNHVYPPHPMIPSTVNVQGVVEVSAGQGLMPPPASNMKFPTGVNRRLLNMSGTNVPQKPAPVTRPAPVLSNRTFGRGSSIGPSLANPVPVKLMDLVIKTPARSPIGNRNDHPKRLKPGPLSYNGQPTTVATSPPTTGSNSIPTGVNRTKGSY